MELFPDEARLGMDVESPRSSQPAAAAAGSLRSSQPAVAGPGGSSQPAVSGQPVPKAPRLNNPPGSHTEQWIQLSTGLVLRNGPGTPPRDLPRSAAEERIRVPALEGSAEGTSGQGAPTVPRLCTADGPAVAGAESSSSTITWG